MFNRTADQNVPERDAAAKERPASMGNRARRPKNGRFAASPHSLRVAARTAVAAIERIEPRCLLSVSATGAISNTFGTPGGTATQIDLAGTFDESTLNGTLVRFDTSLGNIDLELYDQAEPATAQNFLNYVANNLYNNSVIHRSQPGFVLQGGGYAASGEHIVEGPPVANEFDALQSNVRGTISAVPGDGGTAKGEWSLNLADNSGTLDPLKVTVFGHVIGDTLDHVDAIAALPIVNASTLASAFNQLPVRNDTGGDPPGPNDFVFVNSAKVIDETRVLSMTAISDNPSVVNPLIANGILTLNYGTTVGSARITITATDSTGSFASQAFVAGNGELTVQIGAGGVGSTINFLEADRAKGSVSLAKGGSAFVKFTGTGLAIVAGKKPGLSGTVTSISGINAIDTGTGSTLTIKTKGGDNAIDVANLITDGPLKTLSMKPTRFTGTLTIGGTLKSAALGSLTSANVTLGGDASDGIALGLSLGTATDVNLISGVPIKSIKAVAFVSTGTPGTLTAPTVTSISSKGAFAESLNTTGAIKSIKAGGAQKGNITAFSLGSLSAASLDGGIFNFSAPFARGNVVGKVAVKGTIANTTIRSLGNIGSISAALVTSGRFYAGANVPDEEFPPFLPTDISQFTAQARIASVKITTGVDQLSIAAALLGKLTLGKVATDGPIPFGLAATSIDSMVGRTADTDNGPGTPFAFKKLDDQATFDAGVVAKGLELGNFAVKLF